MAWRRRLSTSQREELYDRVRGTEQYPRCHLCQMLVLPGDRWVASHELSPHLGGNVEPEFIAHASCNARFAAEIEVPSIARNRRVRQRHIGAYVSRHPMPGGRDDPRKRTVDGRVVERRTGAPWRPEGIR